MIEIVFTVDYEIYGNGEGSLDELVVRPAEKLRDIFRKVNSRFVAFVEAAELEVIEAQGTDSASDDVRSQIKSFHGEGFEIGLHLHPQWYNARYEDGKWQLDYSEYNLCTLPPERIAQILDRSIQYLRSMLGEGGFTPFSFRAGNWLLQPSEIVAKELDGHGIKVDSSVFKGGVQRKHGMDYRRAISNDYYWAFSDHVDIPDESGILLEIPTYTQMVPIWKMVTAKKVRMQRNSYPSHGGGNNKMYRFLDFMRLWYPLKLDYCRMTLDQLITMVDGVIREDRKDSARFRPIVAIGHTKDLIDYDTVQSFLSYLGQKGIKISTFKDVYHRCGYR